MVNKEEFVQELKEDMYNRFMDGYDDLCIKVDNMIKEIEDEHNIRFVKINGYRTLILDED